MAEPAIAEKPVKTRSERGAELLALIIESFQLLQSLSIKQLGLHTNTTIYLKEAKASGDANLIEHAEQEEARLEQGCQEKREQLRQTLRKLQAIKLSMEGKTSEEIKANFDEEDEAIQCFQVSLDAICNR